MKKIAAIVALLLLVTGAAGCQRRDRRPQEESSSPVSQEETLSNPVEEAVPEPEESEEESEEEADTGEVTVAAEEMLAALQSGDRERIKAHLDYTNLLQLQDGQPDTNHLVILRQLHYTVGEAAINGATATVRVELTNLDMKVVLPLYFKAAGELEYNDAISETPSTQAELEAAYVQLFQDTLEANRDSTFQRGVEITLLQVAGKWKAQVSPELRSAALGDYFAAQGQADIR